MIEEYEDQRFDRYLLDGFPTRFDIDNNVVENEIEWIVNWLCDKFPHAFADMSCWINKDKVEVRLNIRTDDCHFNIL